MEKKIPTKYEIKEIIDSCEYNLESVYKNSALLYGMSQYKNKVIGTYYYYDIDDKYMAEIHTVFNKVNMADASYLFFKFKHPPLFNKTIRWKLVKMKTFFKRMVKNIFLYNNYYFHSSFIEKELHDVKNIEMVYMNHLEEIKKQFIALEFSKHYGLSYEWIIKHWNDFLNGKIGMCSTLKEKK